MNKKEYQKIVYEWNRTEAPYPKDKTIHQLFEEQVKKTPDNIAVVFEDKQLTYRELNEKANQLAHTIRNEYREHWTEDVQGNALIGIYINRSYEMIIGILGILKSGAAYVPFDKADPEERLKFKINNCNCKMVLTSSSSTLDLLFLTKTDTLPVAIDSYWDEIAKAPKTNPKHINKSTDLAYVIYTSGSTGNPKGTLLAHQSSSNLITNQIKKLKINNNSIVLQFASIGFDASVWEIFSTLCSGAKLIIPNQRTRKDITKLVDLLEKNKINIATLLPVLLGNMLKIDLPYLKTLVVAGDICPEKTMKLWSRNRMLINAYGPTESSVCASLHYYKKNDINTNIGKPLNNVTLYVLDPSLKPVPIGVLGELYIGGDSLARGYLNRPDLTKERFIENPFASDEDKAKKRNLRIYKTGDLVRWLPDGNLEFIGRNDDQIKIRGFRVELGEIESKLAEHPEINQCVVMLYRQPSTNNQQLCAYYVPDKTMTEEASKETESAFIDTWESIYNKEYSNVSEDISNNDFSGWNSSYTNKPIPISEMIEWRDNTITRILSLNPSYVYEIGSGTGLIAHPLLNYIKKYIGIDFSDEVVRRLNSSFSREHANKAWAYKSRADELDKLEFLKGDITIDTIIINSVLQYFPDREYLEDVIMKAVNIINTGSVFVGDVRDYRLHGEFHLSVEMFKHHNDDNCQKPDIAYTVNHNIKNENELLVAPEYFIELSMNIPKISCVEILPKRGKAHHEMNRFRYDVIIHIGLCSGENNLSKLNWVEFDSGISLERLLEKNTDYIALRNYPNKWVIRDCKVCKFLSEGNDKIISECDKLNGQYDIYYDIEGLYKLAKDKKYELYTSLSLTDKSCYNLIFYKEGKVFNFKNQLYKENCENLLPKSYSNNPIKSLQKRKIPLDELKNYLAVKLPEYMIPAYFVELNEFPLNTNGKIDKKALPTPELKGDENNYVAPLTELEKQLADIWQELLGIGRIGINDDFFRMGGNSILTIKLANRISYDTKLKVQIADIFKHPTINRLVSNCSDPIAIAIPKTEIAKVPLSFAQERLWFIEQYEGGTSAYNIPMFLELDDSVNIGLLKLSLESVFKRHEIFRTILVKNEEDVCYQHILSELPCIDDIDIGEKLSFSRVHDDINCIFDLSRNHPVKVFIYHTKKKNYLLINVHHIAFDGWSLNIFLREFNSFYSHYAHKTELNLPELDIQYKDFSVWQRNYLTGEVLEKQMGHWKNKLDGYETLNFPTDKTRPPEVKYIGDDFFVVINRKVSSKLKKLAAKKNTTIYNILLSAFFILLHKNTGQKDIILGTPIANRHYPQLENIVGFFVNALPLRLKLESSDTFENLSAKVISLINEIQEYQDLPFEKLVDMLDVSKDPSIHPIFQIMFGVQSFGTILNTDLFKLVDIHNHYRIAKFDLSLFIDDSHDKFKCTFNYAISLFNSDTIKRLSEHYSRILEAIVSEQNILLSDIQLLSTTEYNKMVYDWNKTEALYPKNKTIHQLFEEQVVKTPDCTAVIFEDKQLTYQELNEKANQLAYTIRNEYKSHWNEEVKDDTLIGIYIDRSLEMIVGILGILKSGAAYVPFDSADPEERLKFKIDDSGCKMVLTSSSSTLDLLFLTKTDTLPVAIDSYWDEIAKAPKTNPKHINKSTDLAYIIYTSGSTGNPKGVMIEHYGVVNLIKSHQKDFKLDQKNIGVLQFASISFDASVSTLFCCLLLGNTLYVCNDETRKDVDLLQRYILNNNIQFIDIPAKLLESFESNRMSKFKRLSTIIVAGEICDKKTMDICTQYTKLINAYGPTEATVCTTLHKYEIDDSNTNIGRSISNKLLYVLDPNLKPVPIGVPGELYIGGDGLARGYLNRPELTKERFLDNPFVSGEDRAIRRNLRIYKTGDLVRWLPDGNLEFIGRNDHQIKIRGFRVELGEIESKLSAHSSVQQAVVTVYKTESGKSLAAYYTLKNKLKTGKLRDYLTSKLPEHMVPTYFIELKSMPLNTSGKINRKLLPLPDAANITSEKFIAPRTGEEKIIAEIWKKVLNLPKIGIKDNFYAIGGNSLNAVQLASKIEKAFLRTVPVAAVFQKKTIEEQAEEVARLVVTPSKDIVYLKNNKNFKGTLILFPPGFSGAEAYCALADRLNQDIRVIGLNNYFINNPKSKLTDMNTILKQYLKELRKEGVFDDKKPVSIGGWSAGGNMSLSILRFMKNINIKNVFLFDAILSEEADQVQDKNYMGEKPNDPDNSFFMRFKDVGYTREQILTMIGNVNEGTSLLKYEKNCEKIVLFKTFQEGMGMKVTNQYNGWGKYFNNIEKIDITSAHHFNILTESEALNIIAETINHTDKK